MSKAHTEEIGMDPNVTVIDQRPPANRAADAPGR